MGCGKTQRVLTFNCTYSSVILRQSWEKRNGSGMGAALPGSTGTGKPCKISKGHSPRGHLWTFHSCTMSSVCHIILWPNSRNTCCNTMHVCRQDVKMYDKKQRQPLYISKKEADFDNFKLCHHSKALRDIPATDEQHRMSSRIRTRSKTRASCPWKSGFPPHCPFSESQTLTWEKGFQPILYNLNLPKSGKRAPFCISLCPAKVLHLN